MYTKTDVLHIRMKNTVIDKKNHDLLLKHYVIIKLKMIPPKMDNYVIWPKDETSSQQVECLKFSLTEAKCGWPEFIVFAI